MFGYGSLGAARRRTQRMRDGGDTARRRAAPQCGAPTSLWPPRIGGSCAAARAWRYAFADAVICVSECAQVRGWARRFYQGSPDHRAGQRAGRVRGSACLKGVGVEAGGTPERPGRVVTLLPDAAGVVHGVLYCIPAAHAAAEMARLCVREKVGRRHVRKRARISICVPVAVLGISDGAPAYRYTFPYAVLGISECAPAYRYAYPYAVLDVS